MEIKNISMVSTPYYEGDLTEVMTDQEFIGEDKEWYWEQLFLNEKAEVVAKFIQRSSEDYQGKAEQLSQYRQDIFVRCYDIDENNKRYDIVQVIDLVPHVLNSYDYIEFGEEDKTFIVEKDGLTGFIDINGVEIIKPQYIHARSFENGVSIARDANRKCGLINKNNDALVPFLYDDVDTHGPVNGYCVFYNYDNANTTSFVYDSEYKLILEHKGRIRNLAHGYFAIETSHKTYEIRRLDNYEKQVIEANKYERN